MFEMRPSVESRRPKIKLNSISKPIASCGWFFCTHNTKGMVNVWHRQAKQNI
nr:MAG TPA: protein of unknown function (DUF3536) [Bacteriophage sp.]